MPPKDKKDKKLSAKEKEEAKRQKKSQKMEKTTAKRNKKEVKELGEEDIESIIAKYNEKERQRTAVSMTVCEQPSPRSNFSMTALPNGEMLMFGGEFCDGQGTVVYNDLYRWHLERQEWKQIESLNTPPPRCSHQAVCYKDKVYIFGGEYATLDQFHHYSDMWALDIKTNTWAEIPRPKGKVDWPSPRSGHRMVLWRGYIVLFGGFYEALREVRWYNDLYIFSFQEERWTNVTYRPHSQTPKARSGFLMSVHALDDVLYVHGGYSREKRTATGPSGQKKKATEGVVHQDTWMMNLRPALSAGAGAAKGRLDASRLTWQKVSKKGTAPPPRCGAVIVPFKNKGIVFGGVMDQEGLGHSMVSTFYNDIYAFDFDRRRWYQLGLKSKKVPGAAKKKKKHAKRSAEEAEEAAASTDDGGSGSEEEDDEEDKMNNGDFFGYIDETGAVVYMDLNAPDPDEPADAKGEEEKATVFQFVEMADGLPAPAEHKGEEEAPPAAKESKGEEAFLEQAEPVAKSTWASDGGEHPPPALTAASGAQGLARYFSSLRCPAPRINPCLCVRGSTLYVYGGVTELGDIEVTLDDCWTLDLNKRDSWKCVLPGTMQNLTWRGEADDSTSARSDDYDSDEDEYGFSDDDDDDDAEDSALEEGENEDGADDGDEPMTVAVSASAEVEAAKDKEGKKSKKKDRSASRVPEADAGLTAGMRIKGGGNRDRNAPRSGAGGSGLMAEINTIREELPNAGAEEENPFPSESLREFFSRTSVYWKARAVDDWKRKNVEGVAVEGEPAVSEADAALMLQHRRVETQYGREVVEEAVEETEAVQAKSTLRISDALSDKDIKRIAFELADTRFQDVLPIMERLRDLEQQVEEESPEPSRGSGRGGKHSGSAPNKNKKSSTSSSGKKR